MRRGQIESEDLRASNDAITLDGRFGFFTSERVRRLSKESFWIVLGQVCAVSGSLFGVRLLTELLSPDAYGELALGMTVAALFNQTILGPLCNGIARFYALAKETNNLGGYLRGVLGLLIIATGSIVILIPIASVVLSIIGRKQWISLLTAAIIFSILSGYNSILSGIQNAARQRSVVALHQGIEPWARFAIAAGLIYTFGATSVAAMVGYCIGLIIVNGSQYIFIRNIVNSQVPCTTEINNWQNKIWQYSWPFTTWGVFTWFQLASDRWALSYFGSLQDVGLFTALYQLGYYPMSMGTSMLMQLLTPIFFQRSGDASDEERNTGLAKLSRRLVISSLGATGAAFLLSLLFHTNLFRILVSKEYQSVSYLLPWIVLSGGLFASAQIVTLTLMSQLKTQMMMLPKIITAIFGLIFNIIGAYLLGTEGVVIGSLCFSALLFIWMCVLFKRTSTSKYVYAKVD